MKDDIDIMLILIGVALGVALGFMIKVWIDTYILIGSLPI